MDPAESFIASVLQLRPRIAVFDCDVAWFRTVTFWSNHADVFDEGIVRWLGGHVIHVLGHNGQDAALNKQVSPRRGLTLTATPSLAV